MSLGPVLCELLDGSMIQRMKGIKLLVLLVGASFLVNACAIGKLPKSPERVADKVPPKPTPRRF